jgi:peptide/nickel transport system ATP-binding protein
MSVLFITHDLGVVGEIADHVVVMQNGEVRSRAGARHLRGAAGTLHQGAARLPAAAGPAPEAPAGDRRLHEAGRPTPAPHIEERRRGVRPAIR